MSGFPKKRNTTVGPIVFAAGCAVMLIAALAPSPVRIELFNRVEVNSPAPRFPETEHTVSQTEIDAIVEHPLFNPDRKKDPPLPSQSALPGLDTYRLAGVIAVGTIGIAIVERKQTKVSIILKIGDTLDGRTVTGIVPQGVTFSSSAGSETLNVQKIYGASVAPLPDNKMNQVKSTTEVKGGNERR